MLRTILVTDSRFAPARADIVVWLGAERAPAAARSTVIEASSIHAAAVFVAAERALLRISLAEPLAFLAELAELGAAPALRSVAA